MAEHRATAPVHAARHAADPAALPLVRPLVHGPGRVQPRRPVRHPQDRKSVV